MVPSSVFETPLLRAKKDNAAESPFSMMQPRRRVCEARARPAPAAAPAVPRSSPLVVLAAGWSWLWYYAA